MAGVLAIPAGSAATPPLAFDGITVTYRDQMALSRLTLALGAGEVLCLLGPSGCGKTTALRVAAGFVAPGQGRVFAAGRDITALPPRRRGIGIVVQNYALFPHMDVAANVGFGLAAQGMKRDPARARIAECLGMVGMGSLAERLPHQISGGQQQRVAIARALAIRPNLLLLDEPLSALDAQIRRQMLEELVHLHQSLPHISMLYVTHDQAEALRIGHRIAILRGGVLEAEGPARTLYAFPPTRFCATFLGRTNLLPAELLGVGVDGSHLRVGGETLCVRGPVAPGPGAKLLCVRRHALRLGRGEVNTLRGILGSCAWHGDHMEAEIILQAGCVTLTAAPQPLPDPGTEIDIHFDPAQAHVINDDVTAMHVRA